MLDDHTTAFTSILFQRRPPTILLYAKLLFIAILSLPLSLDPLFIFSLSAVLFFSSLVIQSDLEGQVRFVDFLANNENATPDVLHLVAQSLDQPGLQNQATRTNWPRKVRELILDSVPWSQGVKGWA